MVVKEKNRPVKRRTQQICPIKIDPNAKDIINRIRVELANKGIANSNTSEVIRALDSDATLAKRLCDILVNFAGETGANEGAEDTLRRLVDENKKLRCIASTAGAV